MNISGVCVIKGYLRNVLLKIQKQARFVTLISIIIGFIYNLTTSLAQSFAQLALNEKVPGLTSGRINLVKKLF